MENLIEPLDSHLSETTVAAEGELLVTEPVQQAWREISAWSTFFAVLLFLLGALLVLVLTLALYGGLRNPDIFFPVLFFLALIVMPAWWLMRFGTETRRGLRYGHTDAFEKSFDNLTQAYRFFGIATGIYLVIFAFKIFISALNYY